jgi:hypothetical protein
VITSEPIEIVETTTVINQVLTLDEQVETSIQYKDTENESRAGKILPSVLKKIEKFKSDWRK